MATWQWLREWSWALDSEWQTASAERREVLGAALAELYWLYFASYQLAAIALG